MQVPSTSPSQAPGEHAYTVLVVPTLGSTFEKLHLESPHVFALHQLARVKAVQLRRLAWLGGSLAFILLSMAVVMAWHYFTVVGRVTESTQLREENINLKQKLIAASEALTNAQDANSRMKHMISSLQNITQLSDPDRKLGALDVKMEGAPVDVDPRVDVNPDKLIQTAGKLKEDAKANEDTLRALTGYFEDRKAILASAPSIWPARGWVTSEFGFRLDPYTGERRLHEGLDIANAPGTTVSAPADGTVVYAANESGYGNVLVIDHGSGIKTRYGHLSHIDVRLGNRVTRGQPVATVGNSGRSTGPHLHYEVRINGVPENPRKFILDNDEPADGIDGYLAAGPGGARSAMGGGD